MKIDGEMQFDAAGTPGRSAEVPQLSVASRTNTFIFPTIRGGQHHG